ncbi:MAG: hypothetical protein LBE20_06170 [Deltaproteobacteria bacterium]|jgi:shikimate dehydrogenase|nr:hypothetical protein [Deltaproteobacteria bacterium]
MLEAIDDSTIIINATSAGMLGMPSFTPFDTDLICGLDVSKKIFFDFVFNPVHTSLLNYFKDKGATTIDGLWLMIYQGINALSLWLDCEVQPTEKILLELHNELEITINKRMKL